MNIKDIVFPGTPISCFEIIVFRLGLPVVARFFLINTCFVIWREKYGNPFTHAHINQNNKDGVNLFYGVIYFVEIAIFTSIITITEKITFAHALVQVC